MIPIILASESKYKLQLIDKLGIKAEAKPSGVNETAKPGETPEDLVRRLSISKALSLCPEFPGHLIIGADQVANFDGKVIGKPGNHTNAVEQLSQASGKKITFLTGICLVNSETGCQQYRQSNYEVKFRQLTRNQIENYLLLDKPYDCAGSFKSEGLGICLFEYIRGDDPNALVGLPLIELTQMLLNEGVDVLSDFKKHSQTRESRKTSTYS